jgi:phosphatidylglycerophosphatase A
MPRRLKQLIGSGLTSGILFPKAPGTEGSLVAIILGTVGWYLGGPILISALFILSLAAGFWAAPWYIQSHGEDPESFVMDEWSGQFLSMHFAWFLPDETEIQIVGILILSSFLLFRFFDILKPLGIKQLESLPGAFGVIADDLLAGFYTFLTLFFVILAVL